MTPPKPWNWLDCHPSIRPIMLCLFLFSTMTFNFVIESIMHVSGEGVAIDALSADFPHDPDIMYDAEFDYSSYHNYYTSNNDDESEIEAASVNAVTKDDSVGDSLHTVNPSIGKTTRSSKRQRHPLNSDSDELTKNGPNLSLPRFLHYFLPNSHDKYHHLYTSLLPYSEVTRSSTEDLINFKRVLKQNLTHKLKRYCNQMFYHYVIFWNKKYTPAERPMRFVLFIKHLNYVNFINHEKPDLFSITWFSDRTQDELSVYEDPIPDFSTLDKFIEVKLPSNRKRLTKPEKVSWLPMIRDIENGTARRSKHKYIEEANKKNTISHLKSGLHMYHSSQLVSAQVTTIPHSVPQIASIDPQDENELFNEVASIDAVDPTRYPPIVENYGSLPPTIPMPPRGGRVNSARMRRIRLQIMDWRDEGIIPRRADNQGQCGDCYLFSSRLVLESQALLNNWDDLVKTPSVQQMLDCIPRQDGINGCDGGNPSKVYQYLYRNQLLPLDQNHYKQGRYFAQSTQCERRIPKVPEMYLQGVMSFGTPSSPWENRRNNELSLLETLKHRGPITVSIASSWIQNTDIRRQILTNSHIDRRPNICRKQHSLALIGLVQCGNVWCWIAKSGWGPAQGNPEGLVLIKYNENTAGVSNQVVWPLLADGDDDD